MRRHYERTRKKFKKLHDSARTTLQSAQGAMQRCCGCNRTANAVELRYHAPAPDFRPRCEACHRRSALWQTCSLAGCETRLTLPPTETRCEPVEHITPPRRDAGATPGTYGCPACRFANDCTFAAVVPLHHPLEQHKDPPRQMQPVHLAMMAEIHLWLMPIRNRCIYYIARVILWRRFGVLAGIIAGGGDTNHQAAGRRISRLKQAGQWPTTEAKVLLVGIAPSHVRAMVRPGSRALARLSAQEKGRLRGCRGSLSRQFTIGGLTFADFQRDPGHARWADVPLVNKLAGLLRDIGITTGGHPGLNHGLPCRWNANTEAEEAFRRSLHTSAAMLFAWP